MADKVELSLDFYQDGIMRALLQEQGGQRFRISQEGIVVVEDQLVACIN